jgi:hypothetical protein
LDLVVRCSVSILKICFCSSVFSGQGMPAGFRAEFLLCYPEARRGIHPLAAGFAHLGLNPAIALLGFLCPRQFLPLVPSTVWSRVSCPFRFSAPTDLPLPPASQGAPPVVSGIVVSLGGCRSVLTFPLDFFGRNSSFGPRDLVCCLGVDSIRAAASKFMSRLKVLAGLDFHREFSCCLVGFPYLLL